MSKASSGSRLGSTLPEGAARRMSWNCGDTLDCTAATHKGVTIQFGGGPHPEDWYGTLDDVPDALELTRRSEGPPRIVVHPKLTGAR